MPQPNNQNKLSQFWQELKRRKVVRVITVYAAAAFVILELLSIIIEPLRLPEWTLQFAIVFLCIGFIITIIVSWVFDVTPEGGIVKTEPVGKVKEEDSPKSSSSWKIASYISFVVIVGLIVLNVIPRANNNKEILEKSIAVLPFINDSPDEENEYFINGIMDEMLIKLQAIKDFRVPGRTSVEQYRNPSQSIPEIAAELGVNYIVEGSGQKYGNTFVLRVQLLDGHTGMHLWGESIEQEIESVDAITSIQSGIAESIAKELKAVISPEEKQIIENTPTTSLTAHDFYLRGIEELQIFELYAPNMTSLEKAENLFHKALSNDPNFSKAYLGLARVYWQKHYSSEFFSQVFMDSAMILAETALSCDEKLAGAYLLRGDYYSLTGKLELAEKEYDKGIRYNPNDWRLYYGKSIIYRHNDQVIAFENAIKAAALNRGPKLAEILSVIGSLYLNVGLDDRAMELEEKVLKLTGDSASYYRGLANIERSEENYLKENELLLNAFHLDSVFFDKNPTLAHNYMNLGQYEEALHCFKKYQEYYESTGHIGQLLWSTHRIGYAYSVNGYKEEAEAYFRKQIEYSTQENDLGRYRSEQYYTYYDLAGVYAFLGDKEKAYDNLRIFKKKKDIHRWLVELIKTDRLFDSIRDEPEFQQIVRDVEVNYQVEAERVKKWLEDNDML